MRPPVRLPPDGVDERARRAAYPPLLRLLLGLRQMRFAVFIDGSCFRPLTDDEERRAQGSIW